MYGALSQVLYYLWDLEERRGGRWEGVLQSSHVEGKPQRSGK